MNSLHRQRWPLAALPVAVSVALLSSCASSGNAQRAEADGKQAAAPGPGALVPVKLVATGRGTMGYSSQYTYAQQKLLAMRAAQLDAYRNLAEQLHGLRVQSNTTTASAAIQSDTIRSYVDVQLRGAKVVSMTALGEGSWEAVVEMEVPTAFQECLRAGRTCSLDMRPAETTATASPSPQPAQLAACNTAGCTGSSASFVSK